MFHLARQLLVDLMLILELQSFESKERNTMPMILVSTKVVYQEPIVDQLEGQHGVLQVSFTLLFSTMLSRIDIQTLIVSHKKVP